MLPSFKLDALPGFKKDLPTRPLRELIRALAHTSGLPAWGHYSPEQWLEALILQESGGNAQATRYEAHQDQPGRQDSRQDGDRPNADDGSREDDKSYGLMQVMGYNVRRMCGVPDGTPMDFSFMLRPLTNLAFGLSLLTSELEAVGGDVARALARYNGGPTGDRKGPDGKMRRQVYVDGVAAWAARVSGSAS